MGNKYSRDNVLSHDPTHILCTSCAANNPTRQQFGHRRHGLSIIREYGVASPKTAGTQRHQQPQLQRIAQLPFALGTRRNARSERIASQYAASRSRRIESWVLLTAREAQTSGIDHRLETTSYMSLVLITAKHPNTYTLEVANNAGLTGMPSTQG